MKNKEEAEKLPLHPCPILSLLAGPASPSHGSGVGIPAGLGEGAAQDDLDLGVDRAQIVGSPFGDGCVDCRVQPEQDLLAPAVVRHRHSGVQGAGVDHGLGTLVGAQDHQQVRDHLRSALVVHGDDVAVLQAPERLVHHGDRAFHDLLAGGDDGSGLLALEHGLGDLGRVGQVGEAGILNGDASDRELARELELQRLRDLLDVGA